MVVRVEEPSEIFETVNIKNAQSKLKNTINKMNNIPEGINSR